MYVVLIIVVVAARMRRGTRAQQCRFWGPMWAVSETLEGPRMPVVSQFGPMFCGSLNWAAFGTAIMRALEGPYEPFLRALPGRAYNNNTRILLTHDKQMTQT